MRARVESSFAITKCCEHRPENPTSLFTVNSVSELRIPNCDYAHPQNSSMCHWRRWEVYCRLYLHLVGLRTSLFEN